MTRVSRRIVAVLGVVVIGVGLAACGSDSGDSGGGDTDTIIRGTTDLPVSLDPAGAYDLPSYDIIYNVYQNLVQFPPGETKPLPEAAESCEFTDDVTYECKMRADNVFSDGSTLDAEDVVFSFERNVKIADPNGASSLLANMKSIEAKGSDTVVFNLAEPDATWPSVLATASFAIVPSDSFPADKLQDDASVIGSGRYTVEQYTPGQQTVLQGNSEYKGEDPAQTNTAIIQYFDKASALKLALEEGSVDVAYRSLSPTDLEDLESADGVSVVQGEGAEIRYLNFNLDLQPGDDDAQKLAIRQAVAQTIDRQSIVDNVYNGTVKPLYSMIPASLPYQTESFKDAYGESPDVDAATKISRRRRRQDPGAARGLVDPVALRALLRRRVRRDQAPARRFRPLRGDAEVDRVEPVLGGGVHRQVPDLSAGLVPGLSGSRRLRRQLPLQHQLPQSPLRQPGDAEAAGRGEGVDR